MSETICILGRQPAIGLAELESILGADSITVLNSQAALLTVTPDDTQLKHLGGTVKVGKLLNVLPSTSISSIKQYLVSTLPEHMQYYPGKLHFGISMYGFPYSAREVQGLSLACKKSIVASGKSCRVIPNESPSLSSAQVLHNKLARGGLELLLVKSGNQVHLAATTSVQDIDAYAARDHGRPQRDARVGMLPPKLAQIIINLTAAAPDSLPHATILDPFCGTGVILQEAQLMGFDVYGTDIDPRMIDYSQANIRWLQDTHHPLGSGWRIEQGDATRANWPHRYSTIACETYLGTPFTHSPSETELQKTVHEVNLLHRKFLQNVARQTQPHFRLCLALPAWRIKEGFLHLPILDHLEELGYTRLSFVHAKHDEMIYHREGQVVGRELVVLRRK